MTRGGVEGVDGARLRSLRQRGGWSLAELAAAADTNPNSLSRIERNVQCPGAPLLRRLAEVLDVETSYLAPLPDSPSLRQLRERDGHTLADRAQVLGISSRYVSAVERGANRPRDTDRWAQAYGLTPREFEEARSAARTAAAGRRKSNRKIE